VHPTPRILGGLPFAGFKGWAALLFALTSKGARAQGASFECGSGVSGFSSRLQIADDGYLLRMLPRSLHFAPDVRAARTEEKSAIPVGMTEGEIQNCTKEDSEGYPKCSL
jgi:hypothetical protein